MRWLEDDAPLARASLLALAIGFAGDAYLLLGIRSAAAFSAAALIFPLLAAVALAAISVDGLREITPRQPLARFVFLASCSILLLLLIGLALTPPIARDELTHHLALPALYVASGRIVEVPFADQGYFPMLIEMFYTPLLAWLPDQTPKLLHLLFAVASAAVVGIAAKRETGRSAGAVAFALILFTPVVALLSCTAYVDLGLLFYTAVAIAALLRWYATGSWAWLIVSALNAGFAASSKYNGLVSIILLSVGAVLAPQRRSLPKLALVAAMYAIVALAPITPWFAKNYAQTGNPMFPLFHGVFGGRDLPDHGGAIDVFSRRRFLYGESWFDIAAIPLRIFTTGRDGDPGQFDGVLCPLMLIGIAATLFRTRDRTSRLLLAFAASYFAIAFFQTTLRARYVVPILPPLALITAPILMEIAQRQRIVGSAVLAAGALFAFVQVADKWLELSPLAYVFGGESREEYVARFVPEFPVVAYANENLPADARLYLAFLGTRSYYCRRPFTYDYYYSGVMLRQYLQSSNGPADVLAHFRGDGITHMIAADELLGRYLVDNLDAPELARWQMFASNHLTRQTSAQGVSLYAID